jgi:hypothetical protein
MTPDDQQARDYDRAVPLPRRIRGQAVLTRYWIEFDWGNQAPMAGTNVGCGVTAFDREDALGLIEKAVFANKAMPPIKNVIADVDIATLDEGHVIPNMGALSERGVWFPNHP